MVWPDGSLVVYWNSQAALEYEEPYTTFTFEAMARASAASSGNGPGFWRTFEGFLWIEIEEGVYGYPIGDVRRLIVKRNSEKYVKWAEAQAAAAEEEARSLESAMEQALREEGPPFGSW